MQSSAVGRLSGWRKMRGKLFERAKLRSLRTGAQAARCRPDIRHQFFMAAFARRANWVDVPRQFEISTRLVYKCRRSVLDRLAMPILPAKTPPRITVSLLSIRCDH
jgi:hypothetical protein